MLFAAVDVPGRQRGHPSAVVAVQQRDLAEPPAAIAAAADVQQHLDGRGQLTVQRRAVQTAQCRKRFQPGRDLPGLLACTVPAPPSCPVLSAASRSTTSAPRTSPTTIRSGRIRSACRTS